MRLNPLQRPDRSSLLAAESATRRRARELGGSALWATAIALVLVFSLFPIAWIFLTSIKVPADAFAFPPKFLFSPTLQNYVSVFVGHDLLRYMFNSVVIATGATLLSMLVGAPAAYSFSRFRFRGRSALEVLVLMSRLIPQIALLLPLYMLYRELGLIDTHLGLILAYTTFVAPFTVFVLMGFFADIPRDLEEAALIDGCSPWGAFLRVVLPLSLPGLAATFIFGFLYSWNEFMYAVILTGEGAKTLPVMITGFITARGIEWGNIASAGSLILLPVIIFVFLGSRGLIRGLTMGAVKE